MASHGTVQGLWGPTADSAPGTHPFGKELGKLHELANIAGKEQACAIHSSHRPPLGCARSSVLLGSSMRCRAPAAQRHVLTGTHARTYVQHASPHPATHLPQPPLRKGPQRGVRHTCLGELRSRQGGRRRQGGHQRLCAYDACAQTRDGGLGPRAPHMLARSKLPSAPCHPCTPRHTDLVRPGAHDHTGGQCGMHGQTGLVVPGIHWHACPWDLSLHTQRGSACQGACTHLHLQDCALARKHARACLHTQRGSACQRAHMHALAPTGLRSCPETCMCLRQQAPRTAWCTPRQHSLEGLWWRARVHTQDARAAQSVHARRL